MQTLITLMVSLFSLVGLFFVLLVIKYAYDSRIFSNTCKAGDPCKYYLGDLRHDGVIIKKNGCSCTVRDTYDKSEHEVLNTCIYPR